MDRHPGHLPILIADDNDDDVAFVLQGFADVGVTVAVTRVRDGDSCLEMLANPRGFRLVLIDFYLPKKDGAEVIEILRARGTSSPPIVILTSHIAEREGRRLRDLRVRAILEKPSDLEGFAQLAAHLVTLADPEA